MTTWDKSFIVKDYLLLVKSELDIFFTFYCGQSEMQIIHSNI